MSYATVSKRLADILMTVRNVHNVHEYLRDIPNEADFEKAFSYEENGKNKIGAWMITRFGVETDRPSLGPETVLDVTHKIELQGFYGLSDAEESEKGFQESIDELILALRTKYLLQDEAGNALDSLILCEPPQVAEIGHGQFAAYFVHYARVLLSVRERVQG